MLRLDLGGVGVELALLLQGNLTPTEQTSQGFSSGAGMLVGPKPATKVLYYSSQTSTFYGDLN